LRVAYPNAANKVPVTRVDPAMAKIVRAEMPELTYHPLSRLLVLDRSTLAEKQPVFLR